MFYGLSYCVPEWEDSDFLQKTWVSNENFITMYRWPPYQCWSGRPQRPTKIERKKERERERDRQRERQRETEREREE